MKRTNVAHRLPRGKRAPGAKSTTFKNNMNCQKKKEKNRPKPVFSFLAIHY
ncbi:hypothetical protein [Fictibacillus sp. UD]|uniref:hypothetical protein n=1 Tax=Fictibacillus sp. UD TaxID=3038777 RepID=UPI003748AF92